MPKHIIADSCFWFALFNERDDYHVEAMILEEDISIHNIIVPWPTLYESLNTRFMRKKHDVARFRSFLERPTTVLLEDNSYRDESLEFVINQERTNFSLVDHVIRCMLSDENIRVDALISFNPSDFYDICDQRSIEMLYR